MPTPNDLPNDRHETGFSPDVVARLSAAQRPVRIIDERTPATHTRESAARDWGTRPGLLRAAKLGALLRPVQLPSLGVTGSAIVDGPDARVVEIHRAYVVVVHKIDGREYGGPDSIMVSAFSRGGAYIGDPGDAFFLAYEKKVTHFERRAPESSVVSIGRTDDGRWYGWSHRACYGFKAGDTIGAKSMLCTKNGGEYPPGFPIKDEMTAKGCARMFAANVA